MLELTKELLNEMVKHSKEAYPDECCGIMLGKYHYEKVFRKEVLKVVKVENKNSSRAHDRYEIDPKDFSKIEEDANAEHLDIVGIYHSHPDHPDAPSQTDRDVAWPDFSYLIVSVQNGEEIAHRSWSFDGVDDPFSEEELVVK